MKLLIKQYSRLIGKIICCVILLALQFSCDSKKEQSITFEDKGIIFEFVNNLERDNIPFKIKGNTVWYFQEDKVKVKKVFDQAIAVRPVQYTFTEERKMKKFISLLSELGVTTKNVTDLNEPFKVLVPSSDRETSKRIFRSVITED